MTDHMARVRAVIIRWAMRHPEIRRVYLYGSRIRGRSNRGARVRGDSDLDIAIEFKKSDGDVGFQLWMASNKHWHKELQSRIPWRVDLQWYHPTETPNVVRYVTTCHVIVYRSDCARFASRSTRARSCKYRAPLGEIVKRYIVVGRTRASAVFRCSEFFRLGYKLDDHPPQRMIFQTRYVDAKMDHLIPEDLWVEIHVAASSIQQALENAFNGAREIANIIGFTANAYVGDLYPEIGFEVTACVNEREFFQAFLAERPVSVVPGRVFNVSVISSMIGALAVHSDRDRLLRAITQYQIALDHWTLGSEIASIAHLFMAVENVTTAALREYLRERNIDEATLANEWGFKTGGALKQAPYLTENARMRLVFHGDVDCHRDAKWVSDHFEHGLKNFGVLRPKARPVLVRTASHVRRAIIDASNVISDAADIMNGSSFSRPRGLPKLVKYLYGRLQGDPNSFAAPGQLYPSFVWQSKLDKVTVDEKGQYGFTPRETFTAKFGKGVKFKYPRFEIWDGAILVDQPANPPQLTS